jgi:hypothetical protein
MMKVGPRELNLSEMTLIFNLLAVEAQQVKKRIISDGAAGVDNLYLDYLKTYSTELAELVKLLQDEILLKFREN